MPDIRVILELQETDAALLRAEHELEELPEARQIMACRAKRKEIKGKQDQVIELADEVEGKLERLQAEEERVIGKINALQAKLDSTRDYRVTQSVTRDMQGQVKRQGAIAEEQNALLERQIKIDKLADQVADMLAKVDHREEHLTAAFKEKGGKLRQRIVELKASHDALVAELEEPLAKRYEQLRAEKGGVAVARLEGDHCSACSTTILIGQLAKLKKGGDLGECPNCHRLLVVRSDASDGTGGE